MSSRDDYIKAIKDALLETMRSNLLSWFLSIKWLAPIMKMGLAQNVISFVVGILIMKALDGAEMLAFFKYTDFRVNAQGNEFVAAAMKNREAQLKGTEEEKLLAKKELMVKFAAFAAITG